MAELATGSTSSGTLNTLPDWYTQYGQALTGAGLNQLQNVNNYQGALDANGNPIPRVAGLSGQQQQAADLVGQNVGSYKPYLDYGTGAINQGISAANNAGLNYGVAGQTIGGALGALGSAQDTIAGVARPLAGMEGALNNASTYLSPASNSIQAGGTTLAGNPNNQAAYQAYLNPYTQDVDRNIAMLGNRNLFENVLPNVNSTFTGAGQFGSSRNAEFTNRALRDTQQGISLAQAQNDAAAVAQAQNAYAAEQQRQLASGQALGGLSNIASNIAAGYGNEAGTTLNAGGQLANTAQLQGQLGSLYGNLGNNQLQQASTLGNLGNALIGAGSSGQQLGVNDANALLTTGGLSQSVQQKALDAAYQDYLDQRDRPIQAIGALSNILPNVSGRITPNQQQMTVNQPLAPDPTQQLATLIGAINSGGR